MANIQIISRQACTPMQRLTQKAFIGLLIDNPAQEFFLKLDLANWQIVSFDPLIREVCVDVFSNVGVQRVSVTVTAPITNLNRI